MLQKAIRCLVYPPTSGPEATIVLRLMAGAVFFCEGLLKFRVCEPRCGPVYQAGDADARGARTGDRRARNRRRPSSHWRPRHAAHQCAVPHRDARGDTVHQDFAVPGHLPAARATRPAGHGGVGRAARDSLRVRPNHDLYLSARRRSRALVAGCTAPAAPSQRRGGLERHLPQLGPQG